ncbi:DUF2157 domain-containing protein [Flammeovirgaceae bacterium SG7u.111]|nr:DUF2157 domain-containing protein [Flammeovirgaceae bacterium SG7u.132]WPO35841.1 DUF2157 domain-containing protein [Flammeovirgaceae bacterium SG7u.111]
MEDEKQEGKLLDKRILFFLLSKKIIEPARAKLALGKLGVYPDQKEWLKFVDIMLLTFSAGLFINGVFFFFAFNWDIMHKFVKLGLVSGGMLVVGAITFVRSGKELAFQVGLSLLCLLTGAWLATFGQIYQTGANAYDFFFGWTLLIVIWVAISRFPPLWIFLLVLLNTTAVLFAGQVLRVWDSTWLFLSLSLINFFALSVWEYLAYFQAGTNIGKLVGGESWLKTRWVAWLIGIVFYAILTNLVGYVVFENVSEVEVGIVSILTLVFYPLGYFLYRNYIKDLVLMAVIALSVIVVGNFVIFSFIEQDFISATLIAGLLSIGVTVLVVYEMVGLTKKWKADEN